MLLANMFHPTGHKGYRVDEVKIENFKENGKSAQKGAGAISGS